MPGHQETVSSSSVKSIISVGRSASSKGYSNGTNLRRLSLQALPFCQQHSRISSANVFKKSKQAIRLMAALRFLVIGTLLSQLIIGSPQTSLERRNFYAMAYYQYSDLLGKPMIMLILLPFVSSPNNAFFGSPCSFKKEEHFSSITCPEKRRRKIHVKTRFMGCFKSPKRHLCYTQKSTVFEICSETNLNIP